MKKIFKNLLLDLLIGALVITAFALINPEFADNVVSCIKNLSNDQSVALANGNDDVKVDFNALVVDENGNKSYTSAKFTYLIHSDSIVTANGGVGFTYSPISIEMDDVSNDSTLVSSIAAYNIETEELIPIICNDEGNQSTAYILAGDTPLKNIGLIFSGCLYNGDDRVVDDYLTEQCLVSNSLIGKVKLFK